MRCQCCEQAPATIQIRDIDDWQVTDVLLICDTCAQLVVPQFMVQGTGLPTTKNALGIAKQGVKKAQHAVSGPTSSMPPETIQKTQPMVCSSCGLTYIEFQKNGRLGCPECYQAFLSELEPILERIHGGDGIEHKGRRPGAPLQSSRATTRQRIQLLKRQMEAAVQEENYERAAKLRDEITELETELSA